MIELPSQPQCSLNRDVLQPYIKKALNKCKGQHCLKVNPATKELVLASDQSKPGTLFLEAPLILLPEFELLNLMELGKCCAYCGCVLKVDDLGRMRDKKPTKKPPSSKDSKLSRYLKGLDCDECPLRWCSDECKDADTMHSLLHHRPENKSGTHQFVDSSQKQKDSFNYSKWVELRKYILGNNLEICYYGVMAILRIYYDPSIKEPYEGLRTLRDATDDQIVEFLTEECEYDDDNEDDDLTLEMLHECHSLLQSCFKKLDLSFNQFLHYLVAYKLNNFGGCIYLVASSLVRSPSDDANCRIELYDHEASDRRDSFTVKPVSLHSVELIQQSFLDKNSKTPLYTTTGSLGTSKKILRVFGVSRMKKGEVLTIKDSDYSIPQQSEDEFAVESLYSDEEASKYSASSLFQSKKRTASFTSSGSSFGEGIIKYNRSQIKEMLQQLSLESDIEEEEGDAEVANFTLQVPATFGRARSKSVRFDDVQEEH
ncbi:DEKNAAC101060 [Brettanomyces naardenensis]|uniref:DEKNAAC101060 n=1 Tax=Brettanomyces naardenensis TaxID=13370 RepID=A0A448YGR0_BRENA|nr:DEKNAAC101060 [Brettanomyces naardenensis]